MCNNQSTIHTKRVTTIIYNVSILFLEFNKYLLVSTISNIL
jgi:hypothetical protein